MVRPPVNLFEYVMRKGPWPSKQKYSWKPDWRLPPGVDEKKVFLQVLAVCAVAAIPVYGLKYLRGRGGEPHEDMYSAAKKLRRAEREKWIESDEMPYK